VQNLILGRIIRFELGHGAVEWDLEPSKDLTHATSLTKPSVLATTALTPVADRSELPKSSWYIVSMIIGTPGIYDRELK
jgi:hypothetical protein